MKRKMKDGFTMIELLVVIVIIAVLAMIAFPAFLSWLPNMSLKAAARGLFSDIQQAKLVAVKQDACVGVQVSTVTYPATGGSYLLFKDNGDGGGIPCNGIKDGGEAVLSSEAVDSTSVSLISSGPATLCFTPTSVTCTSQDTSVVLRNSDSRWRRVVVQAAGVTTLESSGDGMNWSK